MHQTIHIDIQGFGAIQRVLQPCQVNVPLNSPVQLVLEQLLLLQPNLAAELERCACAVGDEMLLRQDILERDCSLVLLSPVAGG